MNIDIMPKCSWIIFLNLTMFEVLDLIFQQSWFSGTWTVWRLVQGGPIPVMRARPITPLFSGWHNSSYMFSAIFDSFCISKNIPPVFLPSEFYLQGGPRLVTNGVITPMSRVITPVKPIYFRPIYRGPITTTPFLTDRLGAHLVGRL